MEIPQEVPLHIVDTCALFDELSPQGKGHFLNLQRVEARRNETSLIVSDLNASMNYYALMIQKDLETSTQQSSEEVPPSTDTK